jgi:hypothetical protein
MIDLHQPAYSWHHPVCRASFASRTEISRFSRTLLRHLRITISDATGAQSEVTCFLGGGEALLMFFRAVKSSISGTALLCSSALHWSLLCERPGPGYSRTVFIGDDLALRGNSCSFAADRQSPLRDKRGSLPTLESRDESGHPSCSIGGKYFLFGPCLSAKWTALGSRWTRKQLRGTAQRLHV